MQPVNSFEQVLKLILSALTITKNGFPLIADNYADKSIGLSFLEQPLWIVLAVDWYNQWSALAYT